MVCTNDVSEFWAYKPSIGNIDFFEMFVGILPIVHGNAAGLACDLAVSSLAFRV